MTTPADNVGASVGSI